jgi:hypothetical protein
MCVLWEQYLTFIILRDSILVSACLPGRNLDVCAKLEETQAVKRYIWHLKPSFEG